MAVSRDPFPPNEFHWSLYQEFRGSMRPIFDEYRRDVQGTPEEEERRRYIDQFYNLSPDKAYQFIYYVFAGSDYYPETRTYYDFLGPFRERIRRRYDEAGYEHTYFCWVDPKSVYIRAMRGELPLTQENFELASQTSLSLYTEWLNSIAERLFTDLLPFAIDGFMPKSARYGGRFPFPGWKIRDIQDAIETSGLTIDGSYPDNYAGFIHPKWPAGYGPFDLLPIQALHINIYDPPPGSPSEQDYALLGGNYPVPLTGNIEHRGLPRTYFETLYRRLFNTLKYVDWRGLCRNPNLDPAALRFIAIQDFGLDRTKIASMNLNELCQAIYQEAERRRGLMSQIATEAAERAPAVILQPGSVYVNPEVFPSGRLLRRYTSGYDAIYQACQDPTSTKNLLIFLASSAGLRGILPRDLTKLSRPEICQTLQQYLNLLESTRLP